MSLYMIGTPPQTYDDAHNSNSGESITERFRLLQEGFDLACVSIMDPEGSISGSLSAKNYGGENNDDWPLSNPADREPLQLRGWEFVTVLPSDANLDGVYNQGAYTRGESFLHLDNYDFHGSNKGGSDTDGPLPVNYAGDLTSLGLSTKFDIDGDIQSSLKFTTDAPVWLQKKVETPWGAPISLGAAADNGVGVFNCLYVNFAFWAKQAGEGHFSIGLLNNAGGNQNQIGFLTIPLNGTDEMQFISGGQTVDTGIKLDLAGFDEWHQFTIKYLRSWADPNLMQVEVYVNGVLRYSPGLVDIQHVTNFGLDTVAIAKFGECTCAIDDLIIDGGIVSNVEQDSYSTKDKFILSLPPVPKRTVQPHEMNLVFKDYHDISILHPIKENFDNSPRYAGDLKVKDKTAVMIIKGEGSLDLARMCNGNWDPSGSADGDLGSPAASNAWKEAELIDLSSGYSSYIRQKRNVGSANALAHAQDLFISGSTQTAAQNRADSFWVSYAVIGSNSSHGITKGAYAATEPSTAEMTGTFDDFAGGAGMPFPGGGN